MNTEIHNMMPPKCAAEEVFQAVTACTLGLAVPGENKGFHQYRRAGAEIIRTVYTAKAN